MKATQTRPEAALTRKRLALSVLAVVGFGVLIRLSMPMGFGLFSGFLMAFVLQPVHQRLRGRRMGSGAAALLCSLGSSLLLAGVFFGLGAIIVTELVHLGRTLPQDLAPGGSLHDAVASASNFLREHQIDPDEQIRALRASAASKGGLLVAAAGGALGQLVIFFIMMTMSAFNVLLRWKGMVALAERALPIDPADTRKIFREFQQVGRHVVFGTFAAGLIQGALGGIVCWVTGVLKAIFFGAVTAFLSPIPVVGSLAVWASVGIFRIATGNVASGVAELILGALFVGVLVDDFIRPRLVGSKNKYPALLTFIGLFGGVAVFGPSGLIVGPILVDLCASVLKIYTDKTAPVVAPTPVPVGGPSAEVAARRLG